MTESRRQCPCTNACPCYVWSIRGWLAALRARRCADAVSYLAAAGPWAGAESSTRLERASHHSDCLRSYTRLRFELSFVRLGRAAELTGAQSFPSRPLVRQTGCRTQLPRPPPALAPRPPLLLPCFLSPSPSLFLPRFLSSAALRPQLAGILLLSSQRRTSFPSTVGRASCSCRLSCSTRVRRLPSSRLGRFALERHGASGSAAAAADGAGGHAEGAEAPRPHLCPLQGQRPECVRQGLGGKGEGEEWEQWGKAAERERERKKREREREGEREREENRNSLLLERECVVCERVCVCVCVCARGGGQIQRDTRAVEPIVQWPTAANAKEANGAPLKLEKQKRKETQRQRGIVFMAMKRSVQA